MVDKNIIVNNPTLKGDSYFIVEDSKTQQRDEDEDEDDDVIAYIDNQLELYQPTPFQIDCHCVKSVRFWSFSSPLFSRIRTDCGEIRTLFTQCNAPGKAVLSHWTICPRKFKREYSRHEVRIFSVEIFCDG